VKEGTRRIVVGENTAFPQLAALFAKTPVEIWRDYLTFHYLSGQAAYLPKTFDDARFNFYSKVLGGQSQQLAREKRGVRFLSGLVGEGVGQLYVARYFTPEAKAKAQELVGNLLNVYRQRIRTADWMSPETRQKALEKVASFMVKIGYPDKWRDYSRFATDENDLLGNAKRRPHVRVEPRTRAPGPGGRPRRVGHVAANRECVLRILAQRDRVSGGHSATAFLRSER
jgi:predicted metalloendopeptidase